MSSSEFQDVIEAHHDLDEGTQYYNADGYCVIDLFITKLKSLKTTYIPLRKIANGRFSTVYLSRDINK